MKFFWLRPDDSFRYEIEGRNRWGLPGLKCEVCGATWAQTGVCYPTADLSTLDDAKRFEQQWPVDQQEFTQLKARVMPLLPPGALAPPGTGLGPFVGKASGSIPEFAWPHPWTLLLRESCLAAVTKAGVRFGRGARAQLIANKPLSNMIELEIEPFGTLARECLLNGGISRCEACGRIAVQRPDRPILDGKSLPTDRDVFRLTDLTTMIICSDRWADVLGAHSKLGFRLEELPTL